MNADNGTARNAAPSVKAAEPAASEAVLSVQQILGQQRANSNNPSDRRLPRNLSETQCGESAPLQHRMVRDGVDHQWNVSHGCDRNKCGQPSSRGLRKRPV